MEIEKSYLLFNLLLAGLLASEIYFNNGRSQRLGLALGLVLVGLIFCLGFRQTRLTIKRDWLRIGGVLLIIISLICTGELLWEESLFKVLMMSLVILVGLLSAWAQGEVGHLPPIFWLWVSGGAVFTTFLLGPGYVDFGGYGGAWLWIILGPVWPRAQLIADE